MNDKTRIKAAVSTHSPEDVKEKATDSEFKVKNSGEGQLLIDPEDDGGEVSTHSDKKPVEAKSKSVKASDSLAVPEKEAPGSTHGDSEDPVSYLEKATDMPVIDSKPAIAAIDEDEEEEEITSEFDDMDGDEDEFPEQVESAEEDEDGMADLGLPEEHSAEEIAAPEDEEVEQPYETEAPADEAVAVVDCDEVPEQDDAELQFATIASVVHVIRANRIIASMGKATAKRAGIDDVYMTPQFQDVVIASIEGKGLRKGLVQSGFVLAKVKIAAKATAKVVQAKVDKQLGTKLEAMAARERALEQCLAIAAVGINRRFFKDAKNELKAGLETELLRAGVRGGPNIVRAMFAQYGVSYAKSILTLANKISAMPEEVRNQYASALDMTEDQDFEQEAEEASVDEDEEEFDDLPSTVSAALVTPVRRDRGVLLNANVKSASAMSILNGSQSLLPL